MPSLRSTRVLVDSELRPATVRYHGGVVVALDDDTADQDFGDHVVMPGLVDSHVHVNEPGRTDWEGFTTATRAARAGGTTTIVDMPLNSVPPTTTLAGLEEKRQAAHGKLSCDVGFWGGIVPGSQPEVAGLIAAGVCGFKVFLTDSGVPEFPPMEVSDLIGTDIPVPLLFHAEADEHLGAPGPSYSDYLASRPPVAEAAAIESLTVLETPVHVLHVSSADAVAAIAAHPGMSAETCPHYLTFTDADVTDPSFKCAPPIRGREHREALWEGLRAETLTMVVSDHSPSPPEMKEGDFASAWGGISSLQIRLPVTWTGAAQRGFGLERLGDWLALAPARLAGLADRKGSIGVGKDADFVVFDPDGETVVSAGEILHRHPTTPYEGMRLRGRVVDTIMGAPGRMLARK